MKKLTKCTAAVLAALTLSTTILPTASVVYANQHTTQTVLANQIDKDQLKKEILQDIKEQMLPELNPNPTLYQERGAGGLIATLIAKYGVIYVRRTLPKIIYRHIAKYIGRKVSEAAFVRVFNNVINWGTGAALEPVIANVLVRLGVDRRTANTVASVIVGVAMVFV